MNKNKSETILKKLADHYGDVEAQLQFKNIYQLAIAVILSAQTTDKQVNGATPDLFKRYPDFQSLSQAKQSDVETIIKSTGFFRNKAGNIIKLAKQVTEEYNGVLPESFDSLITLPGIGRKSANVILIIGLKKPAFPVDTHVFRLANRLGYANSENFLEVEKSLMEHIPSKDWSTAHLLLIHHGRNICKARNPLCTACPIRQHCPGANAFIL